MLQRADMDLDEVVKAEQDDGEISTIGRGENRLRYKSWRKKYRKMRLVFDDGMEEANKLFISEHKARSVARRLQEELDQILEILLDVNNDPKTPAHVRWDVRQSSPTTDNTGTFLPSSNSLQDLERRVIHTMSIAHDKSSLPADLNDIDNAADLPPGYLTLEHEEEYLTAIDASLSQIPPTENLPPNVEAVAPAPLVRKPPLPTEKDFAQQSPISVYNWLKNNQPHVFDAPKERVESERGEHAHVGTEGGHHRGKGPGVGKGKKEKHLSKQDLQFEGLDEEIGFDPASDAPIIGSARGRRKRDDDAYRPKGGSSKTTKRKREDVQVAEIGGKGAGDGGGGRGGKKMKKSSYLVVEDD